ncbi:MAG TPA: hypothetical protein VFV95_00365, partial [Vicinamibacterales bacterium]|nr:hypothetical protein [Vicinamibacterales bacterium]
RPSTPSQRGPVAGPPPLFELRRGPAVALRAEAETGIRILNTSELWVSSSTTRIWFAVRAPSSGLDLIMLD